MRRRAASLADLVRIHDTPITAILIEGHNTRPRDIVTCLAGSCRGRSTGATKTSSGKAAGARGVSSRGNAIPRKALR